jgi:hypothetical protein
MTYTQIPPILANNIVIVSEVFLFFGHVFVMRREIHFQIII